MYAAIINVIQVVFFIIWTLSCQEGDGPGSYRNRRVFPSTASETASGTGNATGTVTESGTLPLADQARAILTKNCARCHGAGNAQGTFGIIDDVPAMLASGRYIIPGNSESSLIFKKLAPSGNMPPNGALKTDDVSVIKQWIQNIPASEVTLVGDIQSSEVGGD